MIDEKKQKAQSKKLKAKSSKQKAETKISPKLKKIIDEVSKLSVIELADLVKALEDKFGVLPAPAMAGPSTLGAASDAATGAGAPKPEEKSEFNVVLAASGANKIAVIKAVREVKPDLGLKEAKDLVEAAPKELLTGVKKEEAENAKKKLEEAGAQVELK